MLVTNASFLDKINHSFFAFEILINIKSVKYSRKSKLLCLWLISLLNIISSCQFFFLLFKMINQLIFNSRYNYKDVKPISLCINISYRELPFKKGDTVYILRKVDQNWYEGEHYGRVGIFPISYVEVCLYTSNLIHIGFTNRCPVWKG